MKTNKSYLVFHFALEFNSEENPLFIDFMRLIEQSFNGPQNNNNNNSDGVKTVTQQIPDSLCCQCHWMFKYVAFDSQDRMYCKECYEKTKPSKLEWSDPQHFRISEFSVEHDTGQQFVFLPRTPLKLWTFDDFINSLTEHYQEFEQFLNCMEGK